MFTLPVYLGAVFAFNLFLKSKPNRIRLFKLGRTILGKLSRLIYRDVRCCQILSVFCILTLFSGCGGTQSKDEEEVESDGFEPGQVSTVVTGSNLSLVITNCVYSAEEESDFQSLNCKLLLNADEENTDAGLALVYDDYSFVTAVEGVEISWGVPPDLGFVCHAVRQSTEIFCFRESTLVPESFSVLLSVSNLVDSSVSIRVSSTAVSQSVDQSSPPEVPLNLTATAVSSNQINLSYTDNSDNETSFYIQRSVNGLSWSKVAITAANVVSYSNTGLTASTEYFYRLRACNSAGCSGVSETASDITPSSGVISQTIFVSSTTNEGSLGGVLGADVFCNNSALYSGRSGNWKAVMSSNALDAKSRISIQGEVRNTNGDKVADNSADFWDGTLDSPVRYDEYGVSVGLGAGVWTGSKNTGLKDTTDRCLNWTVASGGQNSASIGLAESNAGTWLKAAVEDCGLSFHLYCIDGQ